MPTPPSQPPWGKFSFSDWHKVVLPEPEKVLRHLGRDQQQRLRDAIERLPEGHILRLKGATNEYRLRVGDWRVRFLVDKAQRRLVILAVGSRGSVYKAR